MLKKYFFILSCGLILFGAAPQIVFAQAEKLTIGQECGPGDNNDRCYTGDCEEGDNGKWYCDCDDDNDCSNPAEGYGARQDERWKCVDGGDATKDNDYCESNFRIKYPHGETSKASALDFLTDKTLGGDELKKMTSKPNTKITIPGVSFSDATAVEDAEGNQYLLVPYLGEFIKAAYRYGIAAAGIFAVVMLINAGFLWTRSGGNAQVITEQKATIEKAVIGLIIAVTSYTLLYLINPNLTKFDSLKVEYVKGIPLEDAWPHGEIVGQSDEIGTYSESDQTYAIPGTTEVVKLSSQDVCWLEKLGKDQAALVANLRKVCIFGSTHCTKVNVLVAPALQKAYDEISKSKDPSILAWKEHIESQPLHPGNTCRKAKTAYCDPISASGGFSLGGHGSDRGVITTYGGKFGITIGQNDGAIGVTAKARLVKRKLGEEGAGTYTDKNNRTHTAPKSIKHWLTGATHAFGTGFDLDFPHNGRNKDLGTENSIPQAFADIMISNGFTWGKDFNDPSHFQYKSGNFCP